MLCMFYEDQKQRIYGLIIEDSQLTESSKNIQTINSKTSFRSWQNSDTSKIMSNRYSTLKLTEKSISVLKGKEKVYLENSHSWFEIMKEKALKKK